MSVESIQHFLSTNPLTSLGVIIFTVIILAGLGRLIKQPLIIWYVLAGIVLGVHGLGILSHQEWLETFWELGISLLIFMVGMWLNPKIIRELAGVSIVVWLVQVVVTAVLGYGIALFLGFDQISSFYIGLGLSFSSTIIVVKLLSDDWSIGMLHGKIILGVLIIQDILALIALMAIGTIIGVHIETSVTSLIFLFLGKLAFLFTTLFLVTRFIFPKIIKHIAVSSEYLFMFAFGWCLIIGILFDQAWFSMEIGALVAGVTLATSPYRHVIMSKMKSLRDFFVAIFFVFLGSKISFGSIYDYRWALLLFSFFVLVGRPFLIMTIMGSMYYKRKNSFLSGVTLAQVSEFGPIIVALWLAAWHITNESVLSIVTITSLITMVGSNYLYTYNDKIFKKIQKYLVVFERSGKKIEDRHKEKKDAAWFEVIIFWYGHIGKKIVESFCKQERSFLVIDSDPEIIEVLKEKNIACMHGDANELDLFDEIPMHAVKIVVATMEDFDGSVTLVHTVKRINKSIATILVAHTKEDALAMYEAGAEYVIIPHDIGAHHASLLLEEYTWDEERFIKEKMKYIENFGSKL